MSKNLLICALLVLVMLCVVSTASAEDTIYENLTVSDAQEVVLEEDSSQNDLGVSDNDEKLNEGNTLTVGEGETYTTIAGAISAASNGDTIFIKNGHYKEGKFTITDKNLVFEGESKDNVIIDYTTSQSFISTSAENEITVKNLQFKGTNSGNNGLFQFTYSNNALSIENCIFDDCGSKNLLNLGKATVSIKDTQFLNCRLTAGSGALIQIAGGNVNIENCLINNTLYTYTSGQSNAIVYNNGIGTMTISGTIISNSNVYANSVIRCASGGTVNINLNSKIVDNILMNRSEYIDTAIFYNAKNTINVDHSVIANNTIRNFIYAGKDSTSTKLEYCNIQDNHLLTSSFIGQTGSVDISKNYWGTNDEPTISGATPYVILEDGAYKLSDGSENNIDIPSLNEESEPEFPADAIFVATDGNDENDGSEDAPVANIAKAIELAKAGPGYVIIKEGTYNQNGITLDGDNAITIIGQGNVIIDGTGLESASTFTVATKDVTVKNIKFENGNARYGGALNIQGSSTDNLFDINVIVENCSFDNSKATRGGAIYAYCTKGNLIVKNSNFTNMDVTWGAICAYQSAFDGGLNVEITKSIFANNKANNGAALYLQASHVTVTDSDIYNNTAAQSPGAVYLTNVTATFDNCKIYDNSALKDASAIAVYAGKVSSNPTVLKASEVTITNCIIENNTATQDGAAAIYLENSKLDISYSSIVNTLNIHNTVTANYDDDQPETVTANNNWWGNNNPLSTVEGKNIVIDNWVIMNVEANATEVLVGDKVKLTIDFNHVNTTSGEIQDLTGGAIPKTFTVTLTSTSGELEPATVEISKGTSKNVIYTVADVDAVISAQTGEVIKTLSFAKGVEPYYGIIYVDEKGNDNNNGSELFPVASIAKAVELALVSGGSGQIIINEGTYTGTDYHVTGDLTVTGKGKVVLDAEGNGRLFYMAYGDSVDKLEISNLTIINVKHNYGAAVYSMAKELILSNLNISSAPEAGSLIYNTGKMTISDSEISNHNGGNVIATSGNYDLTINNTVFKNNTVTASSSDYGIIYISSGKGNLYIEKSKFINSTTRQGVIVAGNSDKKIYVKSSEFINNKMQGTSASGGAINANEKLEVTDSIFINNTACGDGGAINIGRWGDATITKSVFINNAAGSGKRGDAIYNGKKLTINYCVLLSDGNNKIIYHNGEDNDVNAQYNWWGTNDDPSSLIGLGTYYDDWDDEVDCVVDCSNWVVMTVSNNQTGDVKIDEEIEFTVDFTHTNINQELSELIPEVEVSAAAITGEVDAEKITTENNVAKFTYTAREGGQDTVTVTSSNAVNTTDVNVKVPVVLEVVYVSAAGDDINNGTRSSPVKTLEHAIELAQKGKIVILEGDYTISKTITLANDMDIKGEGTVVINGNSTKIFNNNANLNLTNIKFTNATAAVGSIVHNYENTEVMITGCEFYSNAATGSTGGIIHIAKGSLKLIDSKFHENTIKRGVVSCAGDTSLEIKGCEFFNHVTTQMYGIIRIDGADVTIEDTIFRNNSVGNGAGIYITCSKNNKLIKINNDTFIDNKATQSSSGNGAAIFINVASGTADITISNSTFIRNNAAVNGGAIYTNGNNVDVKVDGCTFVNNTANEGNSIYVNAGKFSIVNSVILNENGFAIAKYNQVNTNNVVANDNFWGDNAKANVADGINVARWIIMNASYTTSDDGVLTITVTFDKTNSTSGEIADYTGKLPEGFDVTFTSTSGKLNEVVPVKDGKASVEYTLDEFEDSAITVKVANAEVVLPFAVKPSVIYVSTTGNDDNNGDKDTPVASLEQALKLAEKGQIVILEGTYKTGNLGTISNDLTITGEGKVILDAQNSNRILYVGEDAKVVLENLIMINGFTPDESGALLGNSNELTLINCTLANSSAGEFNGGAIYNVGKLTIINSTIANNTAREGGAIFTQDSLAKGASITIENSIIENNVATGNDNLGGGAIFAQQLADLTITNTTFENNKALTTSSGGAIFISHTEASMKITDSRFIANHANGQEDVGGGAIYMTGTSNYERKGTLTISNTLFEDNSADSNGGAIYSRATTVKVENSVFINNTDENGIAVYGYKTEQVSPSITANKNWWGTNEDPSSFIGGNRNYKPTVNNWAILTITNDTEIKDGNIVKLTVAIDSYTDGESVTKLDSPINVEIPVTITTNKGDINGVLKNGEFTYDLDATGITYISANVDGVEEVLFANTVETTIVMDDITAAKGDNIEYSIAVNSADGTIISKGVVELYIDNELVRTIDVVNGVAKESLFITKEAGKYNITAKYIDSTRQFKDNELNKTLTVSGINNVVTPETFSNFFDENNVLRDGIPFDELTFKGEFNNLGLITIDKPIKLTGDGAQFNNVSFNLDADDVELSNINIVLDNLGGVDGAAIYIGGDNVVVSNNNITYNAPAGVQSYAIEIDYTDDVKIINNNIKYSATSDGDVKTYAVNAMNADNLVFENNVIDAIIPSTSVSYIAFPVIEYYSQGVHVEESENVSFDKNKITVNYNDVKGAVDTIYAVHFDNCDDSRITNNDIELNGHMHAYGLVANTCDNLTVSGNDIKSNSDDHYAAGLQVGGKSSAVVDNNNISAKSNDVAYSVYLDDWGEDGEVNLTNNNIKGESDTVYGAYVEENKTLISGNTIDVKGNHVYGIVAHQTDAVIDGNEINATGKDTGDIVSPQSGVDYNTSGIIVSEGSAEISNNNVVTNGNSTIIAKDTNASITNNGLSASGKTADDSIQNIDSEIKSSGNTEAKKKSDDKPATPVVQITGTNNAKVYYGFGYTVRVTEDGKSIGAGKKVTLKIAGKTLTAKTNANGYATFNLAVKPKAYTVTVAYNGVTKNFKVAVKNVIKAKNIKVKKSAKRLKIKVTLKVGKKAIKGKKVILKIKGKKIKAKTNKKGVATFKVKKNILKKLKAGKKYKYTVTYGKDTVKKTLKVKK